MDLPASQSAAGAAMADERRAPREALANGQCGLRRVGQHYRQALPEGGAMMRRLYAEFIGTAWLVLGGCGSAVLAAAFPQLGIGFAGVAFAFGLTVLTMAAALGPVSGGHFNPAVTVGLAIGGRLPARDVVPYIIAQVLGGIAGAAILYIIATGKAGAEIGSFATNGYGDRSPGKYGLAAALVCEIVMTFGFVTVILGVTDKRAEIFSPAAPLAIGLTLTLI